MILQNDAMLAHSFPHMNGISGSRDPSIDQR
jgi:hypothetical protein